MSKVISSLALGWIDVRYSTRRSTSRSCSNMLKIVLLVLSVKTLCNLQCPSFLSTHALSTSSETKRHSFEKAQVKMQGRIQDFFLGGGPLVSCSTSTPINHIVFFSQNTSCIRKPQVISGGGGAVRTPYTLPLDPPLKCTSFVI